ncbi:NAD(P)H-binding protein [Umezawaea tangerina]|uniref:Uncharacterized protein YbjT (DUF2867 family) n=1 Tax=Umezawaea tangerina TaxID=84725 RepID=A0A2T0THD8_9PSEU|nr:NAD(P)H-binding protein [Umezawaea tangerina]PRY45107.1 uncharacterized protein YbjT (DUF2867 family) [Umezawaea tangerina]
MIVITTPAGQIGRQVLDGVVDRGEPVRVIARDPSRLAEGVRDRVEVVRGSHGDADVLDRAFDGADSVFWLVSADPRATSPEEAYVGFSRPALKAFTRHGVSRVVGVSALGRGVPGNAGHVTATLAMDDAIAATGVAYRALVLPSFMDNALRQVDRIRDEGVFSLPLSGDLKAPTCATRDIAAAAVRLLLDHSWTGTGSVAVLGPEDLSGEDMARIMAEVLGRPVRFERTPLDVLKPTMVARGMSEAMAQSYVDMVAAKDNGLDNAEPRTPESTSPTGFRQWCEEVLKPAVLA